MNNADLGITIQKFICDHFSIPIPIEAKEQFTSNYNEDYISDLKAYTDKILGVSNDIIVHDLILKEGNNIPVWSESEGNENG